MKIQFCAILTASLCFCTYSARAQTDGAEMEYGQLLSFTTQQTARGMNAGLTTVKLNGSELKSVPTCDVSRVGSVQTYTQSLTQGTCPSSQLPGQAGGRRSNDLGTPAATSSVQCGYLTLPTNCATVSPNCFSQASGPCTSTGICNTQAAWPACTVLSNACNAPLTLPPLCNPLTSVSGCTSGSSDCGALTLYPACSTSAGCLTLSGTNCSTSSWFCSQATIAPGCSNGPPTFSSGGSCMNTYNWDCINTSNSLCSTSASGCSATRGIGCIRTFAPQCLTYKGSLCPNGPPIPVPVQNGSMLLALSIIACIAGAMYGRD
jgi:hypothetical protein